MPYTPTTPTLLLCQALVDALAADWAPVEPDGADWAFFVRLSDEGLRKLAGRRVYLFPTDYDNSPVTRGEDTFTHRVTALTVERYPDDGDPPRDWTSKRVDFVYERIVQGFDFSHDGPPAWNKKLLTLSADVNVLDVDRATTQKLFHSAVELVFLEVRDA